MDIFYILFILIISGFIIYFLILNKFSCFHKIINYLISGFIGGAILGHLFASSMHFSDTLFAWFYFGTIGSLLILGFFMLYDSIKKHQIKFFSFYVGIFLAALVALILIFYNFKGYAYFILKNRDLSLFLIWIINTTIILFAGVIFIIIEKILYILNKYLNKKFS